MKRGEVVQRKGGFDGEIEKSVRERLHRRKKVKKEKKKPQRERAILSQLDCPQEEILSVKAEAEWNILTLEISKSTFPISV